MSEQPKNPRECMTTVGELIAILQKEDQDRVVIQSKDGEGSGFSPYADFGRGMYEPASTYSGEMHEPGEDDEDEAYVPENGIPALVLWPIN